MAKLKLMSEWLRSVLFCCCALATYCLTVANTLPSLACSSHYALCLPRPVVLCDLQSSSKRSLVSILHSILLSAVLPILSSSAHPVAAIERILHLKLICLLSFVFCHCLCARQSCMSCSCRLSNIQRWRVEADFLLCLRFKLLLCILHNICAFASVVSASAAHIYCIVLSQQPAGERDKFAPLYHQQIWRVSLFRYIPRSAHTLTAMKSGVQSK